MFHSPRTLVGGLGVAVKRPSRKQSGEPFPKS
jgi:hypothetical protein